LNISSISSEYRSIGVSPLRWLTTSVILFTGKTFNPFTTAASSAFAAGSIRFSTPEFNAPIAIGRTPFTDLVSPSRDNSPIKAYFSISRNSQFTCPVDIRIPRAMGRSNTDPSFFLSAGAMFIVIRLTGNSNPVFFIAALTLSFDSLTATSASPTMSNAGIPLLISVSTSTIYPLMPVNPQLLTLDSIPYNPLFV